MESRAPGRSRTAQLAGAALIAGLCSGVLAPPVRADLPTAEELKAAFVVNFVKFVEWPAPGGRSGAAVDIAVLGDPAFAGTLVKMAARHHGGGQAVNIRLAAAVDDTRDSQLVFIGRGVEAGLGAVLRQLADRPVLTVGDTRGYAEAGVILNLYTFDRRIGIEVNTTAAARAQLRLSAHLLRIARIVG